MVKVWSFSVQCFGLFTMFFLSKVALKTDFLDIYLTMFFGIRKFKNTSAMSVILFLKMLKIESKFIKCKKEIQKIFFISETKASENVAINCLC